MVIESGAQPRRKYERYGPSPARGDGFREVSARAEKVSQQTRDVRDDTIRRHFSTQVVGPDASANSADHRPVHGTADTTSLAATDSFYNIERRHSWPVGNGLPMNDDSQAWVTVP
jgi:hypothetical protein